MNPITANTPLLDITQLESFIDLGLIDFLDILSDVTHNLPGYIDSIHTAIREENEIALKSRAHSMRGMLANFGCIAMTSFLYRLEYDGVVHAPQADAVRSELESLWLRSLAGIKQWEQSVPDFMP